MKTYQRPVTPADLSAPIQSLCRELVPGTTPQYVDVRPLLDAPSDECFVLVDSHLQCNGGHAVVGWSIWEWPSLFVEAEFHSVWQMPTGPLLDITPKKSPTQKILFLPDPLRQYEGRQVNNIRKCVSRHPAVVEFLKASDAEYEFLNRGERSGQHGEIQVAGIEAQEYAAIQRAKAESFFAMLGLKPTIGVYDPCPCGSGKKVKWCHGDAIDAV